MRDTLYISDLRKAKMCSAGLRRFSKKYNLDLTDFLENGIKVDKLPQEDANIQILLKLLKDEK